MAEYLLEIGLEEMPAHLVTPSINQLAERMEKFLAENRVDFESITKFSTPRRLAVLVNGLAEESEDITEKVKGPSMKIAKDDQGNWSKAVLGFSRGQGVNPDDLVEENGYLYADKHTPGVATSEILEKVGSDVIEKMNFSTYMKWGNNTLLFVRPIQWLVSLYNDQVVPFSILEDTASNVSRGHRFLANNDIVIKNACDYEKDLADNFVVANADVRKEEITNQIDVLAKENDWQMYLEPGLLEEVNNIVEYPTAFIGSFDEKYLDVPDEVLVTSMREHQRYFEVRDNQGNLLPNFVSVRNGNAEHIDNVISGNEKVLVARLEDGEFFWREDQKLKIEDLVEKLKKVTFHEKIGSIYDHMGRTKVIAEKLASHLMLSEDKIEKIDRAADIYKFDLLTNMVGEFPELQGVMGEKYALLAGEDEEVAAAIREQYMPLSADGELPESEIGAILSVADKLDTLLSFITVDLIPSGSNDPYALRRATQGIVRIIEDKNWDIELDKIIDELYPLRINGFKYKNRKAVMEFIRARVAKILEGRARRDIIDAVIATGSLDIANLTENAQILTAKSEKEGFKESVEALARVANMAGKLEGTPVIEEALFENDSEKALFKAIQAVNIGENAEENIDNLFNLAKPISDFFENTMVMTEDKKLKNNRLSLLSDLNNKAQKVADFSKINTK
ncbi:glycine--tRNA ligase subunit beta [Floricoccus penangensis]|uniref:Glycine--tRNA ligase beta subunit n=2 Tax=Floricoccus penangensis TaxID=1859475 RepID=A0A9Q5NZJ3_9LACT|nr:glycine--tRNA ligase subunit beta [Floricoccus penangensis]OFI46595.1 glycine--tRNA ligase subunit beta [Floricoccus penangensis]